MNVSHETLLICPSSGLPLRLCRREEADAAGADAESAAIWRSWRPQRQAAGGEGSPIGVTPVVLLRADGAAAYPVVDGIPVLLTPEMLVPAAAATAPPGVAARYAEAYAEMAYYNAVAAGHARAIADSAVARSVRPALRATAAQRLSFPDPPAVWLDLLFDLPAQRTAYRHLAPVRDARVLQAGGSGVQAVVLLAAGAAGAWLASPMLGELRLAQALARYAGVADRLHCVSAIGEELPFAGECFDAVFCPGSLHHMDTTAAAPELARVLRPGGRFAAVEPWRAPGYGAGTRLFGKTEPGVNCEVFTATRLQPVFAHFPGLRVEHHGALTRYPLVALQKAGLRPGRAAAWAIARADDAICRLLPPLQALGSSVALLGARQAAG